MRKLKVLVLAVLAMASTSAFAQSSPWWFEGTLGMDYSKVDGFDASRSMNIGVGANYKLTNEWSVGLGLTLDNWDNYDFWDNGVYDDGNQFTITPKVTYTKPMWGRWAWTPNAAVYLAFGEETVIGFGIDLLSFEYKLSDRWALGVECDLGGLYFASYDKFTAFNFQYGRNSLDLGEMGFTFGFHFYL